jgi:hypothetical protein
MNQVFSRIFLVAFSLTLFSVSISSQFLPNKLLIFYPADKSFFYTSFCKKYECTFNHKEKEVGWVLEEFGFLDTRYTGFLDVETIRTVIGTPNFWYVGINLMADPKYHYDKSYVDVAKKYLDPDVEQMMSDLLFLAVGKKYSKDQLLRCMNANRKMNRSYYLEEVLKLPTYAPVAKIPSSQGVRHYIQIECGIDNDQIFSISLQP